MRATTPRPSRTSWTRLVPPPVLIGHVLSRIRGARRVVGEEAREEVAGRRAREAARHRGERGGDSDEAACAFKQEPVRSEGRGVSD